MLVSTQTMQQKMMKVLTSVNFEQINLRHSTKGPEDSLDVYDEIIVHDKSQKKKKAPKKVDKIDQIDDDGFEEMS